MLLPSDRYLAQLLGISDEEYAWFKAEAKKRAMRAPRPAVVCGSAGTISLIITAVKLVIAIGLLIASTFFKPSSRKSAELGTKDRGGRAVTNNQRFAPRYEFGSTQEIATLGSVIPIVYALREEISSVTYGGVRANATLLWSQLLSLGGSQMLRAIFLVGNGPIANIDAKNFASGDNTLASYDFGSDATNQVGARMSVYGRYASNLDRRIIPADRIYGRAADEDVGNTDNVVSDSGVFGVRVGSSVVQDFCATRRPSNQTTFGVYGFCGNDFGMRPNPVFEPKIFPQLVPRNSGGARVKCVTDEIKWAQRRKYQAFYGCRSGITTQGLGSVGGTTTYKLFTSSDRNTTFGRDRRAIDDTGDWSITRDLIVSAADASDSLRNSLIDRLTLDVEAVEFSSTVDVTWSEPTVIDQETNDRSNKAYIAVELTFNTASLSSEELELLKRSTFRIRLRNQFTDDEGIDDTITVEQSHRILVDQSLDYEQEDPTSQADNVSFYNREFNIGLVRGTPTFRFDSAETSWTSPTTSYTFVYVSWFGTQEAVIESCDDIASVVAGRQKTWDNSLIVGELYKIGSGLAVCTSRTDGAFSSDVDFNPSVAGTPVEVTATFETVRTGSVTAHTQERIEKDGRTWLNELENTNTDPPGARQVATTGGHIMRCAIATVSTSRACKVVELGIRSTLGIEIRGIANFSTAKGFRECDELACLNYDRDTISQGATFYTNIYRSDTLLAKSERYSFFSIGYRIAGATGAFTSLNNIYGARGTTAQATFNSIQFNMPSVKQWEFQIEPLTGYEVRNNNLGNLYVLDATHNSGTTQTVAEVDSISVSFTGIQVTKAADTFAITVGRRPATSPPVNDLDYPITDSLYANDDLSLIDTWGKLAESFVFEELNTTADGGPEHEIVYINEIVPNATAPTYDDLALIGLNINSSVEWQEFSQFSCYVTGGKTCRKLRDSLSVGATHLFPDIALDLLTNTTYGRGDLITDSLIDLQSFEDAADWCYTRKYFFDGPVADQVNIRQWCADVAATHLLFFGESNGKFFLRQAMPLTAVEIKALFTAGNILEDSFQLEYFDPEDRDPIRVSVRYREERVSTNLDNPGIFPVVREVLVREASGSDDDRLESIDVSDYCTTREHAIDAAKFIVRMRRIPTHSIRFGTTHEGVLMDLSPGDYIKVAMDETEYNEFNNGVVTSEGALVSTKALADGTHTVIAWDGDANTEPASTTLTVANSGKTATPTGIVFTVEQAMMQVRTYQIERISPTEEGSYTIEAVHMPTNSSDILELADGFDTATNWTIQD